MVATDQDWSNYTIEFGVPQNCSAMVVRLRRLESRHLDNKISGKLWLRNIAISETGEGYLFWMNHHNERKAERADNSTD